VQKEGCLIKRPAVWIFAMLVILFGIYRYFFAETDDARYYIMEDISGEEAEAYITGVAHHYETKEKSYALYLKNVTVNIKETKEEQGKTKKQDKAAKDQSKTVKGQDKTCKLENLLVYVPKQAGSPGQEKNISYLEPGRHLMINGIIYKPEAPSNPGQFNQKEYLKEKNIYYTAYADFIDVSLNNNNSILNHFYYKYLANIQEIKERLAGVYKKLLPEKECGISIAMVLGEKTLLGMDIKSLYQQSGIGHLLAISGLHVSVIFIAVCKLTSIVVISICNIIKYIYCVIYNSRKKGKLDLHNKVPATPSYIKLSNYLFIFIRYVPVIIPAMFLIIYGSITGFSIPVSRAIIMMLLMVLAPLVNGSYDMLSAIGISAVIILWQRPFAIYSCSFLLSYGAVAGIALVYPVLKKMYTGNPEDINGCNTRRKYIKKSARMLKSLHKLHEKCNFIQCFLIYQKYISYIFIEKIINIFLASLSIQIATLPVTLYFFYEFPLYGIFLNIIVIPLASLLVIICATGGITGLVSVPFAKFIMGSACLVFNIYETACKIFLKLPFNTIITGKPEIWQVVIYYTILGAVLALAAFLSTSANGTYSNIKIIFPACISAALFIITFISAYIKRPAGISITFLDVGQGDCIFIQDNLGVTYLVDGGSSSINNAGRYRIIPFLKYNGIRKIDYMVITHSDEDHISGLKEILEQSGSGIKTKNLLLPDIAMECRENQYYKIEELASNNNTSTNYIEAGDRFYNRSGLEITCLHPEAGFNAGTANAGSTVLSVTYGNTSILLTGDIEGDGESALLEKLETGQSLPAKYNVLKVAHHGSKNSSPDAFLKRVSPEISVISCGKNNSYGHPHKELTDRLKEAGSQWIATKDKGAVVIYSDGESCHIIQ